MKIFNYGKPYDVKIKVSEYYNGNLCIQLICENGEPYGNLTVNFNNNLPVNMAYVDTNNMPDAERFIRENQLGTFMGTTKPSGYCEYPLYKFLLESLWKEE